MQIAIHLCRRRARELQQLAAYRVELRIARLHIDDRQTERRSDERDDAGQYRVAERVHRLVTARCIGRHTPMLALAGASVGERGRIPNRANPMRFAVLAIRGSGEVAPGQRVFW